VSNVKGWLFKVLKEKATVVTRAGFWRIPHNTRDDDVSLKIGRYTKPKDWREDEQPETLKPKSELTLNNDEFLALIEFIQENYEPFRQGVKAFIPLDRPFDKSNAEQIRALFSLPDKQALVDFVLNNDVIPGDLSAALEHAKRVRAINEFETMLAGDLVEANWQKWFEENSWVLGSEFVRVLDERHIDTQHISDFLMQAYDGFLDVVEIKRPEGSLQFWSPRPDHGNLIPAPDLVKAITQASRYIFEVEREANSVKFLDRVDQVRTVKPRGILIFGRSHDWNNEQGEAYRILNSNYHNLSIMTYDHVLQRAKRMVGIEAPVPSEDNIPW
tara:strand:- start:521 stop:1507 length:987 start_codon:yes stop_codon:yes gene_type:complete